MPVCNIITSVKDSEIPDGAEERIAKVLAQTLNKPLERCSVFIATGARVYRKGQTGASLSCSISAVDVFDPERNPNYKDAFYKVLQEEFNLPRERVVLLLTDIGVHQVPQ